MSQTTVFRWPALRRVQVFQVLTFLRDRLRVVERPVTSVFLGASWLLLTVLDCPVIRQRRAPERTWSSKVAFRGAPTLGATSGFLFAFHIPSEWGEMFQSLWGNNPTLTVRVVVGHSIGYCFLPCIRHLKWLRGWGKSYLRRSPRHAAAQCSLVFGRSLPSPRKIVAKTNFLSARVKVILRYLIFESFHAIETDSCSKESRSMYC